ncbi:hypothetical protein ID866_12155 [Astraeus odoratus]|nr:hypothetical protein ID866_12155 [Astraeus odoratus]
MGITTKVDYTVSLVSKWQEKGNAHDYVQNKAVDPRPLVQGIANGLKYLHNHEYGKVVHGDLKGYNVLISEKGEALLTDFGLSCLANSSFSLSISPPRGGTLHWCPPEILAEDNPSTEADVWSFGMTALELFTRKDPYHGLAKGRALTARILGGILPNRPDDKVTLSRMTDQWWKMMCWCWEYEPKGRPTMLDIVQEMQHIVCFLIQLVV